MGTISANKNVLDGEGTSKDSKESMDTARLIPNNNPEMTGNDVNMSQIKEMVNMKKKDKKIVIKESNKRYGNMTTQKGIDDVWNNS